MFQIYTCYNEKKYAQITRAGISRRCHCMCDEAASRMSGLNCSQVSLARSPIPYEACLMLFGAEPIIVMDMDSTHGASRPGSRNPSMASSPSQSPVHAPMSQSRSSSPSPMSQTSSQSGGARTGSNTSPFVFMDQTHPEYMNRVCLEAYRLCLRKMGLPTDPLEVLRFANSLDS